MSLVCAIPLLAGLLGCNPVAPMSGYVEGDYVSLASVAVARITRVAVSRGDRVSADEPLVFLEDADAKLAVSEAEARLAEARANLDNLQKGKRPEEIAVIAATLQSAAAQRRQAELDLERARSLFGKGVSSQATLDQAQSAVDIAAARVNEIAANLAVARMPARADDIAAARARVSAAEAALGTARWQLDSRVLRLPHAGAVRDVLRRAGDMGGPSAPVLSILPDGAVKLRLYVPQELLSRVTTGTRLSVTCDGCAAGLTARVSYVARDPEFTPPVIYSVERRQKLVWLIEARPEADDRRLAPGLLIEATIVPESEP